MNQLTAQTKTFILLDSHSRSGTILDPSGAKQKDYLLKMPYMFDTAQKQIATVKKIVRTKKISHAMPMNKLENPKYQFDIIQSNGDDQIYKVDKTANAYYFEVDDVCQVLIEEETSEDVWDVLETINNPLVNAGVFTPYKGILTPSDEENNIRIRFIGNTLYNHRNRALWGEKFSDVTRVPDYNRYVLYTVEKLYQLSKVILKGQVFNGQAYDNTDAYYWERQDVIAIGWYNVGEYSIEYFAYPNDITSTTGDDVEFEVDIDAQELIPSYAAAMCVLNENNVVGDRLLNEYNVKLANLDPKIKRGSNIVRNTMFTLPRGRKLY